MMSNDFNSQRPRLPAWGLSIHRIFRSTNINESNLSDSCPGLKQNLDVDVNGAPVFVSSLLLLLLLSGPQKTGQDLKMLLCQAG